MHGILHHEDHMPKSANFDVGYFLIKFFFRQFGLLHSWIAVLFEAHEAMFAFSPWLRCVTGIQYR